MTRIRQYSNNLFPSFFDNFLSRDLTNWANSNFSEDNSTLPAVNIKESQEGYAIEVAAPGMRKEDFNINLDKNQLIISAHKEEEKEEKEKHYHKREFSYESFQRSFSLNQKMVDGDNITASYQAGILSVYIPKKEEAKPLPARKIDIQ